MCGIAGFVTDIEMGAGDQYKQQVMQMEKCYVHRGPDDNGEFIDTNVAMGFRRLSIIDLEGGHQPLSYDNQRYWITFNGEIYNYIELREMLAKQGYEFQTDSDTEVLLAMYVRYGEEAVKHLRGMFDFVIWDTQEKVLFGARDHFGIKPLYYAQVGDKFYYASENKAIYSQLQKDQRTFDKDALQDYMTFQFVPEPETLTKEIRMLQPGHYFIKRPGEDIQIKRYFYAQFKPVDRPEDEYIKKVRDVLIDSVKAHMRADVPVGSFLSGGIDSSIVVAIAKD